MFTLSLKMKKKNLFVLSALSVSVAGSSLWLWKGGNYFSISLNISARAISDITILLLIGTFYLLIAGRTTAILPSLAFVSTPEDIDVDKLVDNHKDFVVETEDGDCGEKEDSEWLIFSETNGILMKINLILNKDFDKRR